MLGCSALECCTPERTRQLASSAKWVRAVCVQSRSRESQLTAAAARGEARRVMARVHLIIGPVGSGKSTFALQLARERGALRLNLDEWMALLFRPDRPETGL